MEGHSLSHGAAAGRAALEDMTIDELRALIRKAEARKAVLSRRAAAIRDEISRKAKAAGVSADEMAILFGR